MNPLVTGALIFGVTLLLLATGMPIAFALGGTALFFMWLNDGWAALTFLPETLFAGLDDFTLASIPMFVIMGRRWPHRVRAVTCTKPCRAGCTRCQAPWLFQTLAHARCFLR